MLYKVFELDMVLSKYCFFSKKERSRNATKEILKAINNMCEAILKRKTPGDGYTVINTTAIEAKLQKTLVNFINDLKIVQDLGMFTLPKDELFPDTNHTSGNTLGLQVCYVTRPCTKFF